MVREHETHQPAFRTQEDDEELTEEEVRSFSQSFCLAKAKLCCYFEGVLFCLIVA